MATPQPSVRLQRSSRGRLSNQEYRTLWDLIFDRHPRGTYFRGRHEAAGTIVPAKSLMQDLFAERPTALILDEFQTWFDGLHDDPGDTGLKRRHWAFNFVQNLSEIAKERPDLLLLIVSVRDTMTESYRQIHRVGPVVIDFKGESAKEDRRKLLLHRLFENRAQFSVPAVEHLVAPYVQERVRLLYSEKSDVEKERAREEVANTWPFAPELLSLLDDHILMAESAQDKRDLIRVLAELFRSRGPAVPLLTPSDFLVDDDACGVLTLLDSFATTADQEHLREKAIRNLAALQAAGVLTKHAREVISGIWVRSLSATNIIGGTREELQLDLTRAKGVNDNAFTAELTTIVENSFNIHEVGKTEKRYCFKLEENPLSKIKASAKNDKLFEADAPTPPGLLPVMKDQTFIRMVLEHQLRSPQAASELPSRVIVLDLNWEKSPWANVPAQDMPEQWDKPVLIVLPVAPLDINATLGRWLAQCVPTRRNMVRFLVPKSDTLNLYDDAGLRHVARCAYLAKDWREKEPVYADIHRRFDKDLRRELSSRFDRFALLHRWNYQQPSTCAFHVEPCVTAPEMIAAEIENAVRSDFFAPEDFEAFVTAAAQRGDSMKQVLGLLREPPPKPDQDCIPYLGDLVLYEQAIRVTAKDKIALRVGNSWYRADPSESEDQAFDRLKRACFRTGRDLDEVQLGLPSLVGASGIAIPASVQSTANTLFPPDVPTGVPPGYSILFLSTLSAGAERVDAVASPSAGQVGSTFARATTVWAPASGATRSARTRQIHHGLPPPFEWRVFIRPPHSDAEVTDAPPWGLTPTDRQRAQFSIVAGREIGSNCRELQEPSAPGPTVYSGVSFIGHAYPLHLPGAGTSRYPLGNVNSSFFGEAGAIDTMDETIANPGMREFVYLDRRAIGQIASSARRLGPATVRPIRFNIARRFGGTVTSAVHQLSYSVVSSAPPPTGGLEPGGKSHGSFAVSTTLCARNPSIVWNSCMRLTSMGKAAAADGLPASPGTT